MNEDAGRSAEGSYTAVVQEPSGAQVNEVDRQAALVGLPNGRSIAGSKTRYLYANPSHLAMFNVTITDGMGAPLWWGDLDLTIDEAKLVALATALGRDLCVMFEGDMINNRLHRRPFDRKAAVLTVTATGEVLPSDGPWWPFVRNAAGRIIFAHAC